MTNQEHHQRLEVAAADAHQRLAAAARGQHHAEAEQRTAGQRGEPEEARSAVDGVGGLHPAERRHGVEADHRHAHGGHPHAHARPVAHGEDVGDRTHGAEVGALRDRAEDHGQRERGPQHAAAERRDVDVLHAAILSSAPALPASRPQATSAKRGARGRPAH